MQLFPNPFNVVLSFILLIFLSREYLGDIALPVVTSGDNVTHKHFTEMRRLACDETPFLLAMTPRATTLAW
jgi:hypothetical protein